MSTDRVQVSQKVRFEVFKRDKFTCQYCGSKAPDVVLRCDHVRPVADGGGGKAGNDMLNLITSCFPCNSGKGAVPLGDSSALNKQRDVLEGLEERRQQIDMMLAWRDELASDQLSLVERVDTCLQARGGFGLNETGKASVGRWLKKYTFEEVIAALDTAFDVYLLWKDDKPTIESWELAVSKIPGIIRIKQQELERPYLSRLFYIQGILRKRSRARRLDRIDFLEHIHLCGISIDELERSACLLKDFLEFDAYYDAWLLEIGRPF